MITISLLALVSAAPLSLQEAPPPAPLAADGGWVVDYADNACNVARVFGKGKQRVMLALVLVPGRETSQLILNSPYDGKEKIRQADLVITTGPDSPPITAFAMSGSVKHGARLLQASIAADDLARIESAKSLVFKHRGQTLHLATNGMKKPLAMALTCEDDLLRTWGSDPVAFRSIAVRAKATQSPATWVMHTDYPNESMRAGETGTVGVRLSIAADGQVTECKVITSSTFPRLDQQTCAMLRKRARYEPAQQADGTKIPSMSFMRFRWMIAA